MMDWRRVFQDKRRLIVPLAIAAAVNLVVYFVVVYPLTARTASVQVRAQTAAINAANAAKEFRAAESARTGRARADEQLTRFYAEILPRNQAGARRITYLRLAKMAEESNLDYDRRSASIKQDRESELEHLDMTMSLSGEYRDIRGFIHSLETAPEFVIIKDVTLAQDEGEAALKLTLQLATYYRGQP